MACPVEQSKALRKCFECERKADFVLIVLKCTVFRSAQTRENKKNAIRKVTPLRYVPERMGAADNTNIKELSVHHHSTALPKELWDFSTIWMLIPAD